jgi:hypothetical protein
MVRSVVVNGGDVAVTIALTVVGCPLRNSFQEQVAREVGATDGILATDDAAAGDVLETLKKLDRASTHRSWLLVEKIPPALDFSATRHLVATRSHQRATIAAWSGWSSLEVSRYWNSRRASSLPIINNYGG